MNKISDFFTRSVPGGLTGISLIYIFTYILVKIFDKTGFFLKNLFWGAFHLAPTYVVGFKPLVSSLAKAPRLDKTGFTVTNWYTQYFYEWLIIVLAVSFVFSVICYLLCSSKNSIGKDMQPTWWVMTLILLFITIVIGIIFTPMLNSTIPMFFTWIMYFLFGYLPFYISTLLFCGLTARGAYTIKKKILG